LSEYFEFKGSNGRPKLRCFTSNFNTFPKVFPGYPLAMRPPICLNFFYNAVNITGCLIFVNICNRLALFGHLSHVCQSLGEFYFTH